MAGRIRSIKPEILEDEKTASLSHLEWRLFVSLWLVADDHGNLRAEPDYIKGQALWASRESRESVARAVEKLASVSLVVPYKVRGQSYLHISGWEKHQKVDHPGKPRMPTPADADTSTCDDSRESREDFSNIVESLAPDLRSPTSDQDHDLRPPTVVLGGKKKRTWTEDESALASRVLEKLSQRNGISYRGSDAHVKLIVERNREGISEREMRAVIVVQWAAWEEKPELHKYMRPETLFGKETIHRYLPGAKAWLSREFPTEHQAVAS